MIRVMDGNHDLDGVPATPQAVLHSHGLRVTSLRLSVMSAFLTAGGALSADALMETVGFGSLSSIYRALESMESAGVLERCPVQGGVRLYCLARHNGSGHNHFECRGCGRITHVDMELPEGCIRRLVDAGFYVSSASMHFSGTCSECTKREEERP